MRNDGNGESKGTLEGQFISRQSDKPSSEESWLQGVEGPSLILENPFHRAEPAAMSSKEPAEDVVYIPVWVDRLYLSKRTACIIINVCSTCC